MSGSSPSTRRVLLSALAALTVGVGAVSLVAGFSDSFIVRLFQGLAVFGAGAVVIGGAVVLVMVRLAGWRDPESEEDFEALVRRSEDLAAQRSWEQLFEGQDEEADHPLDARDGDADQPLDPHDEEDFKLLVRQAIDELPLELHAALEHVAVVVSDRGRRRRAYGLYEGDTVARDFFHDRIVIFRDTLVRDFGHDPELLRAQVTRTVRHELAHHLGWGERGVRGLGL